MTLSNDFNVIALVLYFHHYYSGWAKIYATEIALIYRLSCYRAAYNAHAV